MIFSCTSDLSISENQHFPSSILLAEEIVLFEIQYFRVVRPAIPIIDHKLDAEVLRYNGQEIPLDVLVSQVRIDLA